MNWEDKVKSSNWWMEASDMLDRHFDPSEGVTLADHLESVYRNLDFLGPTYSGHEYFSQLNTALEALGQNPVQLSTLLGPVALLHDIGKVREDKSSESPHPLTGKPVKLRHPVVGLIAGLEVLPADHADRDMVLALIEEHDTPFSWYMNFQKSGQTPKPKSWAKLDRKINPSADGTGIVALAVFKLADIDGHEDVN
ncbi:MAG: hypothetical protein QGG80_03070, partial [Candidatus Krumholzibacteria bacterium]|nr:hypothetical protein [Candidatus Krumholzibacteria bacterium]